MINADKGLHFNPKNNGMGVTETSLSCKGNSLSAPSPMPFEFMHRGYFPLWRKIVDWGWYKEGNTMRVFLHLLLSANHTEKYYLGHKVLPGQVVTGRKSLSSALNISERQIRTSISHLKSTNEITITSNRRFSIITLLNFDKYSLNSDNFYAKTTTKKSNRSPIEVQLPTTPNNVYNDNNVNKKSLKGVPPLETVSHTKEIIEYFSGKFSSVTGHAYVFSWGKDGSLAKDMLKTMETQEIKTLIDRFFESTDEFIISSGRTMGVFKSQINKLRQLKEETKWNVD
jgi:hypothetical protein